MAQIELKQKAENYGYKLADKVRKCRGIVESNRSSGREIDFSHIHLEGKPYFEGHELRALDEIGTVLNICRYSEINVLQNKVTELFIKKTEFKKKEKNYEQ